MYMYGCVVMNIKDKYQKLIAELMNCRLCQEKFGFEPHPVVFGNMNAKIVQISKLRLQRLIEQENHLRILVERD